MRIHREGYRTLVLVITILVLINAGTNLVIKPKPYAVAIIALGSFITFIYFLQFFRSPVRVINSDRRNLLIPADGEVVAMEETLEEEYFKDKRLQISVFMSPLNVHSNRMPVSGTVKYIKYHPGRFLVAWHPKSSLLNERSTLVIESDSGREILLRQIAGAVARRIVTYPKPGDRLEKGEEFGFIKFGSRVDIFLPPDTPVDIEVGDKVKAGIDVITKNFEK
ncbi:MAG: phosphatidylserine decarboxylase family protein [Bacteroidales bacterium]|nr:phosphatidylserine decarboxylase family protein [Bacteroidales bacterium]